MRSWRSVVACGRRAVPTTTRPGISPRNCRHRRNWPLARRSSTRPPTSPRGVRTRRSEASPSVERSASSGRSTLRRGSSSLAPRPCTTHACRTMPPASPRPRWRPIATSTPTAAPRPTRNASSSPLGPTPSSFDHAPFGGPATRRCSRESSAVYDAAGCRCPMAAAIRCPRRTSRRSRPPWRRPSSGTAVAGPVNVADATPTTAAELLGTLFAALDMQIRIVPIPAPLTWAAAGAAEVAWRIAGRTDEPPVTRFAVAGLARPFTLDLGRLHGDLGVHPDVDVAQAARQLLDGAGQPNATERPRSPALR